MRDLQPAAGPPREFDLLAHGIDETRRVRSHVRRVQLSVFRNGTQQRDEFFEIRGRSRCVHQSCRKPGASRIQRLFE